MAERVVRVLLVDDEELVREAVRAWLEDEHVLVVEAVSGASALEQLSKEHFDCVLLDLRLKDMGGADVIRMAQASGHNPAWLVLTGNLGDDLYQELRALGIDDDAILLKPVFDMGIILARIRSLVTR